MKLRDRTEAVTPRPVYDITHVMQYLGLCRATVYGLINSGALKTVKIGARRKVTQKALDSFLESREGAE